MIKRNWTVLASLMLLFMPIAAHSNGITALMLAVPAHLFIGNAIIGCVEGLIIARIFKVSSSRAILLMIIANYASAFAVAMIPVGAWYDLAVHTIGKPTLANIHLSLISQLLATFIITILIEWGFCFFAIRKSSKSASINSSLKSSILVNTITYSLLLLFYLPICDFSLLTDITYDQNLSPKQHRKTIIYYISYPDGTICSMDLNGSNRRKLIDAHIENWTGRLAVQRAKDGRWWDLWVRHYPRFESETLIKHNFLPKTQSLKLAKYVKGGICDLRYEQSKNPWIVYNHPYGLIAYKDGSKNHMCLKLDTPLQHWHASNVTLLNGDIVVTDFGLDITILDINHRKIRTIACGTSPLVIQE